MDFVRKISDLGVKSIIKLNHQNENCSAHSISPFPGSNKQLLVRKPLNFLDFPENLL